MQNLVRINTQASLLQILRHLMNHDAAHVVGREWVLTLSYAAEEVLSTVDLEESILPLHVDETPPLPMDGLELIACATLTFEHDEVEFCRLGQDDYDLILFLDGGHDSVIYVDDPIVEGLLREQSDRMKGYKHWWTD